MSDNLTEDQQVEELKKWWKENGRSIIVGAVMGLALIGGWQGWQGYQEKQAEAGAAAYDQFSGKIQLNDAGAAAAELNALHAEHGDTLYAAFANLQMAEAQISSGDAEAAAGQLQQVISGSKDQGLVQIAAIRLARLYASQDKFAEARQALKHITSTAFEAESLAIEGQVALGEGNLEAAQVALTAAQEKGASDSEMIRYLLQQLETPNS